MTTQRQPALTTWHAHISYHSTLPHMKTHTKYLTAHHHTHTHTVTWRDSHHYTLVLSQHWSHTKQSTHNPSHSQVLTQASPVLTQASPQTTLSTHFCMGLSSTRTMNSDLEGMFFSTSDLRRRRRWEPSRSWSFFTWSSLEMSANSSRKPCRSLAEKQAQRDSQQWKTRGANAQTTHIENKPTPGEQITHENHEIII